MQSLGRASSVRGSGLSQQTAGEPTTPPSAAVASQAHASNKQESDDSVDRNAPKRGGAASDIGIDSTSGMLSGGVLDDVSGPSDSPASGIVHITDRTESPALIGVEATRRRSSVGKDSLASEKQSRFGSVSPARLRTSAGAPDMKAGMPPRPHSTTGGRRDNFATPADVAASSFGSEKDGDAAEQPAKVAGAGGHAQSRLRGRRRISVVESDAASIGGHSDDDAAHSSGTAYSPQGRRARKASAQRTRHTNANEQAELQDLTAGGEQQRAGSTSPDRMSVASGTGSRRPARRRGNRRLSIAEAAAFPNPGTDVTNVRSGSLDSTGLEALLGPVRRRSSTGADDGDEKEEEEEDGSGLAAGKADLSDRSAIVTARTKSSDSHSSQQRSPLHRSVASPLSMPATSVEPKSVEIRIGGSGEHTAASAAEEEERVEVEGATGVHDEAAGDVASEAQERSLSSSHQEEQDQEDGGRPLVVSYRHLGVDKSTGVLVSYQKFRIVRMMRGAGSAEKARSEAARRRGRALTRRRTTSYQRFLVVRPGIEPGSGDARPSGNTGASHGAAAPEVRRSDAVRSGDPTDVDCAITTYRTYFVWRLSRIAAEMAAKQAGSTGGLGASHGGAGTGLPPRTLSPAFSVSMPSGRSPAEPGPMPLSPLRGGSSGGGVVHGDSSAEGGQADLLPSELSLGKPAV